MLKYIQHRDPEDPNLCDDGDDDDDTPRITERSADPFDRTSPRHRRFADGSRSKLSSSASDSSKDHAISGKAIDSSTCFDALTKSLMSKEVLSNNPILVVERDRFKLFEEIIGRCMVLLLIGGSACVCLRDSSGRLWQTCLLYTSPSPRDLSTSRMPSSA